METDKSRDMLIDAIRRRFGITLTAVSRYNSLNRDEITNISDLFHLKGTDKEKLLALLYMVSADEQDPVVAKFRNQTDQNDERYNSARPLVDRYGIMLAAALIYNPAFYAMAINYYEAINAGYRAGDFEEDSLNKDTPGIEKKSKGRIINFPINTRMVFSAAASIMVILFVAVIMKTNIVTGRRISNDWITNLEAPQNAQDGISFISEGNEGARVGIMSPLTDIAMSAKNKPADFSAAITYYNKAIKTEKNNPALFVNRGLAFTLAGYVDSAIKDFNKAIELDPQNASAYFNRAAAYAGKDNIPGAISDLEAVIAINADDSEAYYALGVLYYRQYESDESKPRVLLESAVNAFSHIQDDYKNADFIFDFLSGLLQRRNGN